MNFPRRASLVLFVLAACGCKAERTPAKANDETAKARAPRAKARALALVSAEQRRDSRSVTAEDLSSRDVDVRRGAVRALARISDARAHELLTAALADEDREVVAWSAYGIGYACRGRESASVAALIMRAATLDQSRQSKKPEPRSALDPELTIVDALGRCATPEAARTLTEWLSGSALRARAAALALGRIAARRGRLDDATIVALLDAASRAHEPIDTALYPFTRTLGLNASVQARLLEVVRSGLEAPGMRRAFAIRALGRVGDAGISELGAILSNSEYPPNLRAEAARELAKLGEPGQHTLSAALTKLELAEGPQANELLRSANWGALSALLSALTAPVQNGRDVLEKLAVFPLAEADDAPLRRRKITVRCAAAQLLAVRASLASKLVACDPEQNGRIGALAMLEVLDRGKLAGARLRRFTELVALDDPMLKIDALKLLPSHPEVASAYSLLASALSAAEPGVVATAAQILAAYPDRSTKSQPSKTVPEAEAGGESAPRALRPHESVIKALTQAYDNAAKTPQIEVRSALIDAAAALQLLGLKPRIERDCASDNPTLREHAEKALRLLGDKTYSCDRFEPSQIVTKEAVLPSSRTTTLLFDTDVGELSIVLSAEHAPGAVQRVTELARTGFYDNIVVHRVVPGFVVQFGDPRGDGFGGADRPPLRCETSPVPFGPSSVGIALAGRDTGSSQLFVTLGRHPHLDGEYPLVGSASQGFERLAEGDIIRKVTVKDGKEH